MSLIDCVSPNDSRRFAQLPCTDLEGLARWCELQRQRVVPPTQRAALLTALAAAIRGNQDVLASAIVVEIGKTPAEAKAEVEYAAAFLDSARDCLEEELAAPAPFDYAPLGVALLITAFNDPLAGITRKLAPALAAGCPAIVKPSPLAAHCASLLERCLRDVGADWFRFALLSDETAVASLFELDGVRCVSMTGSTAAGRAVAAQAARRLLPCVLELGGNCPLVVLADADLDLAARDLLDRKTRAAGQACSAVNRVFVARSAERDFTQRLNAALPRYACGPSDRGVQFGPVRTRQSLARLRALTDRCLQEGGQLLGQGPNLASSDACLTFPLTLVSESNHTGPLSEEEAFGPLLSLIVFDDLAQLDAALLASSHNLVLYIYGEGAGAFYRERPQLRFGSVGLNTTRIQATDRPTGGFWDAGYGREGGRWGIDGFRSTVNVRGG